MLSLSFARMNMINRSFQRVCVVVRHLQKNTMYTSTTATVGHGDDVLFERIHGNGLITLNRPKALNSLTLPMIRMIYPQMKAWEVDPQLKLVVMVGTGERAFCSGGDLKKYTGLAKAKHPDGFALCKEEFILNYKIGTYKLPFVAIIDGITMGGGVGLSVHGRFRVATERTVFAMPETAIGLFPDVGGGYFLPRLQGKLGLYLALTGYRLKGRDTLHAGIATHFVDAEKVGELESALLDLQSPSEAYVESVLSEFQQQSQIDKDKEFSLSSHMSEINKLFTSDTVEGIFTNLETDGSEWAIKQLTTLQEMSPLSMAVSLRQIDEGSRMSLQDVFCMEYRLSQRFLEDTDFFEGVRAVLIDRDNTPKWQPSTISGVTSAMLDRYFSPLPPDRELTHSQLV